MEVRALQFGDLFVASRILNKIDIKPFVKQFQSINVKDKTPEEIEEIKNEKGIELIMHIFENMYLAEKDICKFVASMAGIKVDDVIKLSMAETKEFARLFVEANSTGEIMGFFKQAAGLTAQKS